jgi:hypothetical protein
MGAVSAKQMTMCSFCRIPIDLCFWPSSDVGRMFLSLILSMQLFQMPGTFTLNGKRRDITVPTTIHVDDNQCAAKGGFTIPYVQWA